jgi:Fe2+ or Zn2+ uptake regulation protein
VLSAADHVNAHDHHGTTDHGPACDAHDSDHRALLRSVGLRATPARLAILDMLCHATAALDAQQVQGVLAAAAASSSLSGLKTDRVTIYRTLNSLAEAGIAHRIDMGDRIFRYAMAGGHAAHAPGAPEHQASRSPEERASLISPPRPRRSTPRRAGDAAHKRTAHAEHTHPHFVCDSCGRIECLDHLELLLHDPAARRERSGAGRGRRPPPRTVGTGQPGRAAPDLQGRRLDRIQVMLYGRCSRCAGGSSNAASRSSKR